MKATIAYIEEPPFGWTAADLTATGADIDLADVILRAIGANQIEHRRTTFSELLSGVGHEATFEPAGWLTAPSFICDVRRFSNEFRRPPRADDELRKQSDVSCLEAQPI